MRFVAYQSVWIFSVSMCVDIRRSRTIGEACDGSCFVTMTLNDDLLQKSEDIDMLTVNAPDLQINHYFF